MIVAEVAKTFGCCIQVGASKRALVRIGRLRDIDGPDVVNMLSRHGSRRDRLD